LRETETERDQLKTRVSELEDERERLLKQVNEQTKELADLRTELNELRSSGQPTKPDNPTEPPHDAALDISEE
jgi:uncharacterized coiled-coil DUF342 family protein